TKNLGVALFVLGKRLGFFEQSTFLDWLVRVTARFREWANSPGVTKLAGWLNQNSEATGRLVAALFRLSMALLKAMAPLSGPMINALATFANILAWIAERAPWVVQGILLMMTAHRIYAVAVSLVNGLLALAIGIHKAYRVALVVGAAASRIAAAATLFLRATLLRTVGATIAHGAATTVASARMVASRVAALASAAAHAVLSGALFRSVGAALAAGAAQVAMGARMLAGRVAMFASAAASAVLSGSLFRTVGAAIAAGAAQLVMGARMAASRAAMLVVAAASALLNVS